MNITGLQNISTLQGLAFYTNNAVNGILFTGGIVALFFIMLMVLIRNDEPFVNALLVSSWSMFVLSAFFWLAALIPAMLVLVFLLISAFSTLYLIASK